MLLFSLWPKGDSGTTNRVWLSCAERAARVDLRAVIDLAFDTLRTSPPRHHRIWPPTDCGCTPGTNVRRSLAALGRASQADPPSISA